MRRAIALAVLPAMLAACSSEPDQAAPVETSVPKSVARQMDAAVRPVETGQGTPLAEREATLGLLNKRNNLSQDIKLKPGETRRIGNVIVKLDSCERTAPWERPPETGAFVQVWVNQSGVGEKEPKWQKVFSGWMFRNSPSLNVVEHPVYDVWVKDCAMNFPGDDAPLPSPKPSAPSAPAAPPAAAPVADNRAQ